jgi:hypothetical protein
MKKYMAGNPFPYKFDVSKIYFDHNAEGYNAMDGSGANDDYLVANIYTHDSSDTSGNSTGESGGYVVIAPGTPGLSAGQVVPMEGFFIKLEANESTKPNTFAYPMMMQYEK